MDQLQVRDLMTVDVVSIASTAEIGDAADLMYRHGIRHLPVVDHLALVGVLSYSDLIRSDWDDAEAPALKVCDVMTADPETVAPDDDARHAGRRMLSEKYGCLPVVQDGKVAGILTASDFVRWLVTH